MSNIKHPDKFECIDDYHPERGKASAVKLPHIVCTTADPECNVELFRVCIREKNQDSYIILDCPACLSRYRIQIKGIDSRPGEKRDDWKSLGFSAKKDVLL